MRAWLLVTFLAPSLVQASRYDLESAIRKDRLALRAASDSAAANVRYLTQLSLEKEKADLLRKQVDLAVADSEQAAQSARSLDSQCQDAYSEIEDVMVGSSRNPPPERVLASLSSSLGDYREALRQVQSQRPSQGGGTPEGGEELDRRAVESISEAGRLLDQADARMKAMRDPADKMQSRFRQERTLRDEIQKAAADISARQTELRDAAPAAKAGIAALGTPPENEQRTRASQKIEDFRSPMSPLVMSVSILLNRSDDFGRYWTAFQKAREEFESGRQDAEAALQNARRRTDDARDAIYRLRSLPSKNR